MAVALVFLTMATSGCAERPRSGEAVSAWWRTNPAVRALLRDRVDELRGWDYARLVREVVEPSGSSAAFAKTENLQYVEGPDGAHYALLSFGYESGPASDRAAELTVITSIEPRGAIVSDGDDEAEPLKLEFTATRPP